MTGLDVMYIEDNVDFQYFISKALAKVKVDMKYEIMENGNKALSCLRSFKANETPKLIFLDINLPDIDGFQVLRQIRDDAFLKHIPVVMLSTSEHPKDIETAYTIGANAYLTKPNSFKKIIELMEDTNRFWLKHNFSIN